MNDDTTSFSGAQQDRRRAFIRERGSIMGPLLHDAELREAARIQELRTQQVAIAAQIESRTRENAQELVEFTNRMDKSYAAWLSACEARDAIIRNQQGAMVELQNAAAALAKEINSTDPHFARVNNWGRPAGYVEEPALPQMPDIRKPRR